MRQDHLELLETSNSGPNLLVTQFASREIIDFGVERIFDPFPSAPTIQTIKG